MRLISGLSTRRLLLNAVETLSLIECTLPGANTKVLKSFDEKINRRVRFLE